MVKRKKSIITTELYEGIGLLTKDANQPTPGQKDLLTKFQGYLDEFVRYYGGNPLVLKHFRGVAKDSGDRSNDTQFQCIPIHSSELRSKREAAYKILSRAGHRITAPADIVTHVTSVETAIRRINGGRLEFPDDLVEKDKRISQMRRNRQYFLSLLVNVVWDLMVEDNLPDLLVDDKTRRQYLDGRYRSLKSANIRSLPEGSLKRVKELEYLLFLEIHRQQVPGDNIPRCPDEDVFDQLSNILGLVRNPTFSLVLKAQHLLPLLIELLVNQNNQNQNQNQGKNNKHQKRGSGGSGLTLLIPNGWGNGKNKFGPTFLDYFDPAKDLSPGERAEVERGVQKTMNDLGEDFRGSSGGSGRGKIDPKYKKVATGCGSGTFKLIRWEDSHFAKRKPGSFDRSFSDILSNAVQRVQVFQANRHAPRERSGNRIWNTSDRPRELLIETSLQQHGIMIPGVTTLMATYEEGKSQSGVGVMNLIILIDVSGSMWGNMSQAIEAAIAAAMVCKDDGGQVSAIAFESKAIEIIPPATDISLLIDRLSRLSASGGTTISAALDTLLQHSEIMGKANALLITDADIYDWTSPQSMGYWDMLRSRLGHFQVWQTFSQSANSQELLTTLRNIFSQAKFFQMTGESFSDHMLKEMF